MIGKTASSSYRRVVSEPWRRRIRAGLWRVECVWGISRGLRAFGRYRRFRGELKAYRALPGAERIESSDLWPCLFDRTPGTPVPAHYFHQLAWAARRIVASRPCEHVDVGSQLELLAAVAPTAPVVFVDIRPPRISLPGIRVVSGSVLKLPFADSSIRSLSCLHVIEHVGLGRYGDPPDPAGTEKAARELVRVLAEGGNLFLSVPVGRERTRFNAHRIYSPATILRYFDPLTLVDFSCEDDSGRFHENADPVNFKDAGYSCGCFWFVKDRPAAGRQPDAIEPARARANNEPA